MKKLLWVGDAACDTGFARATHNILETLRHHYEVVVLALNYLGDPHEYPYPIYPARAKGDRFGVNRVKRLAEKENVDLIVIQHDMWIIPPYLKALEGKWPVVAVVAVDGKNSKVAAEINSVELGIFWTQFGLDEARRGGYTRPGAIIPLGIDLAIFRPLNKQACRRAVLPEKFINGDSSESAFIVGNVNRNQPRKRLDLTISYFAEWIKRYDVPNAYLLLHVAPTGDPTFDCKQLAQYYGVTDRIIFSGLYKSFDVQTLTQLYNILDLGLTTTQGEGWGLTTMEGMACGVPQIVPDWSGLGEWAVSAVELVPCSDIVVTQNRINAIGAVPDRQKTIMSLQALYACKQKREELRNRGLSLVSQRQYSWTDIGEKYVATLETV